MKLVRNVYVLLCCNSETKEFRQMVASIVGENEEPSISLCIISFSAATHFPTPSPASKFYSVMKLDKVG